MYSALSTFNNGWADEAAHGPKHLVWSLVATAHRKLEIGALRLMAISNSYSEAKQQASLYERTSCACATYDDGGQLWIGKILRVLVHTGPGGDDDLFVEARWHTPAEPATLHDTNLPVVLHKECVADHGSRLWPASNLHTQSVMLVPLANECAAKPASHVGERAYVVLSKFSLPTNLE